MRDARRSLLFAVALVGGVGLVCAAGCIPAQGGRSAPSAPPQAPTPSAAAPEAKPAVPVLDPREERQIAKDLVRDVDQYYRLLKEKAVEEASAYVEPEQRASYQDDLWTFVANYALESAQVLSYQLFPQVDGVMAKVKVARTLFDKGSVIPKKSEVWMTWTRREGRWLIRPQEQK